MTQQNPRIEEDIIRYALSAPEDSGCSFASLMIYHQALALAVARLDGQTRAEFLDRLRQKMAVAPLVSPHPPHAKTFLVRLLDQLEKDVQNYLP